MDNYNNLLPNEGSTLLDLCHYPRPNNVSNYGSVYQVKFNSELVFVYVQYHQQYPLFHELISASKSFCLNLEK